MTTDESSLTERVKKLEARVEELQMAVELFKAYGF
jgi:hypothetical protein